MKLVRLIILSTCMFAIGCENNRSNNVATIPESTFVNYYADWLILQEEIRIYDFDSTTAHHKRDSLNQHYGITLDQIDRTTQEYQQDLSVWRKFYDKVVKRLEQLQRQESTRPKK